MKKLLLTLVDSSIIIAFLVMFITFVVRAEPLGIGATIVDSEQAQAVDEMAAMCAAITGIVATEVDSNSAKLRFIDVTWWSQFTTEALIAKHRAELRRVANEDWDRVWPIIIEGDIECYNLKAKALAQTSE